MNNAYDELTDAIAATKSVQSAVRYHSTAMASLLVGNLRSVTRSDYLKALKKELAQYNIHTGKWTKQ